MLVEFDSKPKAEQWRIFKSCGLPIAGVIDSAGKSLHAWVRVDAKDGAEYKVRQERVYEYLADVMDDKGNKNPSRFSRLPGAMRGEQVQQLIAVNLGAASWNDWETENINDESESFDVIDLLNFDCKNDPDCLIGDRWLCRGDSYRDQG